MATIDCYLTRASRVSAVTALPRSTLFPCYSTFSPHQPPQLHQLRHTSTSASIASPLFSFSRPRSLRRAPPSSLRAKHHPGLREFLFFAAPASNASSISTDLRRIPTLLKYLGHVAYKTGILRPFADRLLFSLSLSHCDSQKTTARTLFRRLNPRLLPRQSPTTTVHSRVQRGIPQEAQRAPKRPRKERKGLRHTPMLILE